MFICSVAALAQLKPCTQHTFMRIFGDVFKSAARAIKLYLNFLTLLSGPLFFFLLQFLHDGPWKFTTAHGTANSRLLLDPVSGPNLQTL